MNNSHSLLTLHFSNRLLSTPMRFVRSRKVPLGRRDCASQSLMTRGVSKAQASASLLVLNMAVEMSWNVGVVEIMLQLVRMLFNNIPLYIMLRKVDQKIRIFQVLFASNQTLPEVGGPHGLELRHNLGPPLQFLIAKAVLSGSF